MANEMCKEQIYTTIGDNVEASGSVNDSRRSQDWAALN